MSNEINSYNIVCGEATYTVTEKEDDSVTITTSFVAKEADSPVVAITNKLTDVVKLLRGTEYLFSVPSDPEDKYRNVISIMYCLEHPELNAMEIRQLFKNEEDVENDN